MIRHQNYIHDAGELKKVLHVKTPVLGSRQLAGFVSGSDSGQIEILTYPVLEGGITKYQLHSDSVTALTATPDFKMLFSASSDGSVFVFRISEETVSDT